MIDPLVRPAGPHDVAQLESLEREARDALADRRGGRRWLDTHPARTGRWRDVIDSGVVHVAHVDDVVVGYVVAPWDAEVVRIEQVYVLPEARQLGFGDALLAAAIDAGRKHGCSLVEGEALPGDRETKNLYERAGITARLITVSRRLA